MSLYNVAVKLKMVDIHVVHHISSAQVSQDMHVWSEYLYVYVMYVTM